MGLPWHAEVSLSMTDNEGRMRARRAQAQRKILDAAWAEMAREGVAALSVRELARSVGIRQQSLTYYFPTKHALLDALFADGFANLRERFDQLPPVTDPVQGVVDIATAFVDHLIARPAAYHLMFQGTVPGFRPSEESHGIALTVLRELVDRLAAAGITDPADLALVRSIMSGIAAEQIANDPRGRLFADQTERAIRAVIVTIRAPHGREGAPSQKPAPPTRRTRTARDAKRRTPL
jgi:AcrR family transcriptional regulator